jgi:aminoglycoside 6'-N-acetyltransferase I
MRSLASNVTVRPARRSDRNLLAAQRHELWPDGTLEEHERELEILFSGTSKAPREILVAEECGGRLIGFCELSVRTFAEGCTTDHVGYLEGWFVVSGARRRGVGRLLVEAGERWAKTRGCSEFASDAEAGHLQSLAAHLALGFEDQGLVRCFRKDLEEEGRGPGE